VLAACGDGSDDGRPRASIPLGPAPPQVTRLCERIARRTEILCPTLFPSRGDFRHLTVRPQSRPRFEGYLVSFNVTGFATRDAGHLLIGAQPEPIALEPIRADPELGLRGKLVEVRRATVGGAEAVVVRARPYPEGGLHGGHVIVLWNMSGRGHLVSLHFRLPFRDARRPDRYSEQARVDAALAIARSFKPVTPTAR
jgi:hypothetical protein